MQNALLTHKSAPITGATGGLGSATADALARRGATVVLVSRDLPRGEAARPALAPHPGRTCCRHLFRACCKRRSNTPSRSARMIEPSLRLGKPMFVQ